MRHIITGILSIEMLILVNSCKRPPSVPDTTDMIAFSVWSVNSDIPDSDIYIINSDGSNKSQLTWSKNHEETSPCWLDDAIIAFVSSTQEKTFGEGRIDLIDLKKGKRKIAYKASGMGSALEFWEITPFFGDNNKILVNRGNWDFYSIDVLTRDTAEVTSAYYHGIWRLKHPRVSLDGNFILFTGVDTVKRESLPRYPTGVIQFSDSLNDIYIYDIQQRGLYQITNTDFCDYDPAWSRDGNRIVFSSNRDGNFELYVMNRDGSDIKRLSYTDDRDEIEPTWASDGQKIAFAVRKPSEVKRQPDESVSLSIWVMNIDGSGLRRITEGCEPAWSPK